MRNKDFFLLVYFTLAAPFYLVKCTPPSTVNIGDSPPITASVKLMLVCDLAFSELYDHNRTQIIDYLTAYVWDTNLRFKTLPSVDVTFQISSIYTIQHASDQPFIEQARTSAGTVSINELLSKFSDWVYLHQQNVTNFDIALLLTGSPIMQTVRSWMYVNSACSVDHNNQRHFGTAVLRFSSPWEQWCVLMSYALATLLGAPGDSATNGAFGCTSGNYLMNNVCGEHHYFFSKCSDTAISNFLRSDDGSCLRTAGVTGNTDFQGPYPRKIIPPSLREQCVMFTNNTNAFIVEDPRNCIRTTCFQNGTGSQTVGKVMYPMDNSPCGDGKFCFRGRCLPQGYQLRNVGSGKCLRAGSTFDPDDFPRMGECIMFPTQLEQFVVFSHGSSGNLLATPYSTRDASENTDKCLSVDLHEENLQFAKCTEDQEPWLGWDFVRLPDRRGEFLLFHRFSKTCARVDWDNRVTARESCNIYDASMHWKFHERLVPPGISFLSLEEFQGTVANFQETPGASYEVPPRELREAQNVVVETESEQHFTRVPVEPLPTFLVTVEHNTTTRNVLGGNYSKFECTCKPRQ